MGKVKLSPPIFQTPDNIPIPDGGPIPDPHPALVAACGYFSLAQRHVATVFGYWFPEMQITANPDVPRRERGVHQALVVAGPPLQPIPVREVEIVPSQCQRRLVVLISAGCSSAAIIWLSSLIGPANLPLPVTPVDLSLDLPTVLKIVNEPVGHVSGNVVAASPDICLLHIGLKLAELACKASYGA